MPEKLIECRDCEREVSAKAKACPHCGADRPARKGAEQSLHQFSAGAFKIGCGLLMLPVALGLLLLAGATIWAIIESLV